MLGPPMVYITHISSKSGIIATLGVNESMDTCPDTHEYRVFVSICDICEYSPSKYSCECEYWIAYVRKYSDSQIYTCSIPYLGIGCNNL